jgi:HPt (histidine-containing phosphotransfer) domain-containing protein
MVDPDADLVAAFRVDLAERMTRLAANWARVRGGDPAALEPLLRDVHYLAGTAATFGAPEIGDLAGQAETLLWPAMREGIAVAAADHARIDQLIAALSAAAG